MKQFVATSDAGKINIRKFHGDFMQLHSDVGSVVAKEVSGELDIQTDTGTIQLTLNEINQDVHLTSDVGSIHVDIKQVPESLVLDIDSEIGNVKVKGFEGFETTERSSLRYQKGDKGPVLRARTDVGAITITHN